MEINKLIDRIYHLDRLDPKEGLPKFVKLIEETGELAELLLMLEGYKNNLKGKSKNQIIDEIKYECADMFMMLVIINKIHGHSFQELIDATDEKLNKWEFQIMKKVKKSKYPNIDIKPFNGNTITKVFIVKKEDDDSIRLGVTFKNGINYYTRKTNGTWILLAPYDFYPSNIVRDKEEIKILEQHYNDLINKK